MKIKYLSVILASTLLFVGCGSNNKPLEESVTEKPSINKEKEEEYISFKYSNLVDEESKMYLKDLLLKNDIKEEYISNFFEKVDFYNNTMKGMEGLVSEKTNSSTHKIEFDDLYALDTWQTLGYTYQDFNCRLTSFELFRDSIETKDTFEGDSLNLMMDLSSIEENPLSKLSAEEVESFKALYSYVLTEPNLSTEKFIEAIKSEMEKREVKIKESENISLINAYLYDYEFNESFIGHSGILIKDGEKYVFLEKYSFLTPYVMIEFDSKKDLYDYLMNRLDVDTTGNGIPPVIFENNDVMEY